MPPRRRMSEVDRGRAIAWLQDGIAVREVARRLEVSHSVIVRLQERFRTTGSVRERRRSGRPRATTERQDHFITLSALRERTATANTIRRQLHASSNTNVSDQTIRNRLHEANLRSRRAAVRPILTPAHRAARLAWARHHLHWTRQQWSRVLFTDESRFTLSFSDRRIGVWRRPGERFADATVREHDRYGGGSVMMWGGFALNMRTPLHQIQGNLNGVAYRDDVLRRMVLPALQTIGHGAILQDDNARPHRARAVNDFLQQHQVTRMDWPARSPDLNPIEHLWDELGRRTRAHLPPGANLEALANLLQQEWLAIPQNILHNLIRSMRQRCQACIDANGGHTRY